jgi:exodeoxyribonuclease VII large subunit
MPEIADDKRIFTLLEVTSSIQRTLSERYKSSFWVKAEMNKLNYYPHSGHCYPDLVEKLDGKVIAQLKSTLWKDDFNRINHNFLKVVKSPLKDGIKMLFCAKITFDPMHGLALRIIDIDPVFSLGELEREKQESISLLKQEGIFERNRSLSFPLLPKRIAIISVQTSKGFADFLKMIDGNTWGYKFCHVLFPSLLQGDRAVESILFQLEKIRKEAAHFDLVAIIRGGGGDVGLSCFNDYRLSKQIALFPLPVLTGIGHATNETVVEMVSYRNSITPTELADFLLQKFHNFSVPLQKAEEVLLSGARRLLAEERQNLQHTVRYFRSVTDNVLLRSEHEVRQQARDLFKQSIVGLQRRKQVNGMLANKLRALSLSFCTGAKQEIGQQVFMMRKCISTFVREQKSGVMNLAKTVSNMHPENVLKRGYSITRIKGKTVTHVDQVHLSDTIEITVANGVLVSSVNEIKKSSDK